MMKSSKTSVCFPGSNPRCFRCIWCLTPADFLYRQLGADIQLSVCTGCKENVDPYCEREWLLVVLDMILLREVAYRHALFNRLHETATSTGGSFCFVSLILLASGLLQAMLLWEVEVEKQPNKMTLGNAQQHALYLFLTALFGMVALVSCSSISFYVLLCRSSDNTERLCWALLLPTVLMSFLTLFVQVWESTYTVRLLGSVLMVACQAMGLLAVVNAAIAIPHANDNCTQPLVVSSSTVIPQPRYSFYNWMVTLLILGFSLLGRAAMLNLLWSAFLNPFTRDFGATRVPCAGLQASALISATNDFFGWHLCWT